VVPKRYGYIPPPGDNVIFRLEEYKSPPGNEVNFDLSEGAFYFTDETPQNSIGDLCEQHLEQLLEFIKHCSR
jgi:hypothetical protein